MQADHKPLDPAAVETLLAGQRSTKADLTLVRDVVTWFKLNHHRNENGCSNPDCKDPRDKGDRGREIIIYLKGNQACCRFCFLSGWLLDE